MEVKLSIAQGDTLKAKHYFSNSNNSFIFIEIDKKVFYLDTSIGQMWVTSKPSLKGLGEGHKKLLEGCLSKVPLKRPKNGR